MNILFNSSLDFVTVLMSATESTTIIAKPSKEITVEQENSDSSDSTNSSDTNSETTDTNSGTTDTSENKEKAESEESDTNTTDGEETANNTDNVDTPEVDDQTGQDVSADAGSSDVTDGTADMGGNEDMGISGDMGMAGDIGMETVKDPLLASWPAVIGISSATLLLGAVIGVLLARKKIKKGFEIYED